MDKKDFTQAISIVKEVSPKRNFKQSVDLIVNLRGVNIKKAENNIDHILRFHNPYKEEVKVCALVGDALEKKASICQKVIHENDFAGLKKKDIKKLANKFDFFIAQADIMPKIASSFGRYLGPMKKMPNPKIGAIIPPVGEVEPLVKKLQQTVHLMTRNEASVKVQVGKEEDDPEVLGDNALTAYNAVLHDLPQGNQNLRSVYIKLTMGPSVKVGESKEDFEERQKKKLEAKEKPKEVPKSKVVKKKKSPKKKVKKEVEDENS